MADGGELKDAKELSDKERFELKVLQGLRGWNNGLNINGLLDSMHLSNYRFNKYATQKEKEQVESSLKSLIKKEYIKEGGLGYVITQKGADYLRGFNYGTFSNGGDTKKTYYYAIATTGKAWDENEQKEFYGTWKDVVKKAYEVAVKNKSQVRVSESEGFNNQGHYFHYSNAPKMDDGGEVEDLKNQIHHYKTLLRNIDKYPKYNKKNVEQIIFELEGKLKQNNQWK